MKTRIRSWLIPGLKILLAGVLVGYVIATDRLRLTPLERLFHAPGYLILAVLGYSGQLWIGAYRLRVLLIPKNVSLSFMHSLRLTYLGAFFDVFLITSVGGDAIKAVYLAKDVAPGHRTEALSVLVLDRLLGLIGLLTLTLLISGWHAQSLWGDANIRPYFIALVSVSVGLLAGTIMLFSESVHSWPPMQRMLNFLPFGTTITHAYTSLQKFRDEPKILLVMWVWSVLVHVLGVLSGYFLLLGTGLDSSPALGPFFVAWLISNFVSAFAAFGGVGVGQLTYDHAFRTIAGILHGSDLATAAQLTFVLAKSPGLFAWAMSQEFKAKSTIQAVIAPAPIQEDEAT